MTIEGENGPVQTANLQLWQYWFSNAHGNTWQLLFLLETSAGSVRSFKCCSISWRTSSWVQRSTAAQAENEAMLHVENRQRLQTIVPWRYHKSVTGLANCILWLLD